jgi:hypothetical protein
LKERSRIGGFGLSEWKNLRQASINMNCKGALSLQLLFSLSLKALRQKEVRVKWPQEEDRLDCCCFTICTWIWLVFIKIICLYKAVIKFLRFVIGCVWNTR